METAYIGLGVAAITGLATWAAAKAQRPPKSKLDDALARESVADRQVARLEDEVDRLLKSNEYLREQCRDADRKMRFHRDGWWNTYRAATVAGVDLDDRLHPPFNGDNHEGG